MKAVGLLLYNIKVELLYDSAHPLLVIRPEELKTRTQTDTCTPAVVTTLFVITKRQGKWSYTEGYTDQQTVSIRH